MTKTTAQQAEEMFNHLGDDGLGGFDGFTQDTISIPFLRVLQAISPQCKPKHAEYVEGAAEGMVFNNVFNVAYPTPLKIVVGRFDRHFIEWKPDRGGFVQAWLPSEVEEGVRTGNLYRGPNGRMITQDGNELSDTYAYYVVLPDYIEHGVCLLCLSSTQLKEARRWNNLMINTRLPNGRRALPYHLLWELDTPTMSNDKGDWAGVKLHYKGYVDATQYALVTDARQALPPATEQPDFKQLESGVVDVTPTDGSDF